MDNLKIVGTPLPDMPWEDRPEGSKEVLWRYSKNPVIPRDILPTSNSVFNSAVVPFKGGYAGVFRCDDTNRRMRLHVGFSADAIHWSISETKLEFECDDKEIGEFVYAYDPRVCFIEDRYYVTWCNGYHGPTIGVAYTFDFETFHQLENAYLPFNRNGVMIEQQFAALTIDLGNGSIYISFRGTDDTIVGWKEDLNMGFLEEIPSQKQAVEYVARVARQYSDKTIRIGGHSKGGNLAVYSAAKSSGEIQERIVAVHNNDGPGFAWDISETRGHKRIASRIHTILPQTSVVGMLMEHEKRYQVVHSTYDGLYQHDGFSWQVLGTQFVHLDDFSREGKLVDETLSSWADSLNTQQREALADALYSVFTASGAKTLSELTEEKLKSAAAMLKTYKNLDRETRRMVTEAFMLFFKLGTKNFVLDTQEEGSREIENIRKKISEQYQKLVERKK